MILHMHGMHHQDEKVLVLVSGTMSVWKLTEHLKLCIKI